MHIGLEASDGAPKGTPKADREGPTWHPNVSPNGDQPDAQKDAPV